MNSVSLLSLEISRSRVSLGRMYIYIRVIRVACSRLWLSPLRDRSPPIVVARFRISKGRDELIDILKVFIHTCRLLGWRRARELVGLVHADEDLNGLSHMRIFSLLTSTTHYGTPTRGDVRGLGEREAVHLVRILCRELAPVPSLVPFCSKVFTTRQ